MLESSWEILYPSDVHTLCSVADFIKMYGMDSVRMAYKWKRSDVISALISVDKPDDDELVYELMCVALDHDDVETISYISYEDTSAVPMTEQQYSKYRHLLCSWKTDMDIVCKYIVETKTFRGVSIDSITSDNLSVFEDLRRCTHNMTIRQLKMIATTSLVDFMTTDHMSVADRISWLEGYIDLCDYINISDLPHDRVYSIQKVVLTTTLSEQQINNLKRHRDMLIASQRHHLDVVIIDNFVHITQFTPNLIDDINEMNIAVKVPMSQVIKQRDVLIKCKRITFTEIDEYPHCIVVDREYLRHLQHAQVSSDVQVVSNNINMDLMPYTSVIYDGHERITDMIISYLCTCSNMYDLTVSNHVICYEVWKRTGKHLDMSLVPLVQIMSSSQS